VKCARIKVWNYCGYYTNSSTTMVIFSGRPEAAQMLLGFPNLSVPKRTLWDKWDNFYRTDTLPVNQTTVSKLSTELKALTTNPLASYFTDPLPDYWEKVPLLPLHQLSEANLTTANCKIISHKHDISTYAHNELHSVHNQWHNTWHSG